MRSKLFIFKLFPVKLLNLRVAFPVLANCFHPERLLDWLYVPQNFLGVLLNVLGQWKAKAANPTYAVVEFIDILSLDLAFLQNQKFSKFGLEMVENRLATFIREAEFVLAHQDH